MTSRSKPKVKVSSVWWCEACKRREVALGLPKKAKCSQCLKFMRFMDTMGQPRTSGWVYPKPPR